MWPDHCVQGSKGSELHKDLVVDEADVNIKKGLDVDVDSYSAFGTSPEDTGLSKILKDKGIKTVYVTGLAFDYCVGSTSLDAAKNGFETYLVTDASRSVASESEKTMKEKLDAAGVKYIKSSEIK
mmetsp:Transcript_7818/g.7062  ORF Transcript_7818/g.7062 Transcript_7818/m.7062 type:complete len:125 (+) Transcript_7818:289-663(+)